MNSKTGADPRLPFQHIHQRKQASGRVDVIVEPMVECASRGSDDGRHRVAGQFVPPHKLANTRTQLA
jgi:hypothetical protein